MRKFTNGDSSIHKCYHSDNFYRYKGYPTTYVERDDEFWDIGNGTWSMGSATIPQYGYARSTSGSAIQELRTKTSYTSLGMFSRIKTESITSKGSSISFRSGTNKYLVRQYNTLTGGHSIDLVKYVSSTYTTIGYSVDTTYLDTGVMKEMTLVESAGDIYLWINDSPVKWNTGNYYINDTSIASGAFGLFNESLTYAGRFYNASFFEIDSTTKGDLWDNFFLVDYTVSGSNKTEQMRIPGKIGGHLQTGSPDSKVYNITGRLIKSLVNAHQFDEMMDRFRANEIPIFIHTPPLKVSGYITNYTPPKPLKGSDDIYHDFEFQLIENWFYGV